MLTFKTYGSEHWLLELKGKVLRVCGTRGDTIPDEGGYACRRPGDDQLVEIKWPMKAKANPVADAGPFSAHLLKILHFTLLTVEGALELTNLLLHPTEDHLLLLEQEIRISKRTENSRWDKRYYCSGLFTAHFLENSIDFGLGSSPHFDQ